MKNLSPEAQTLVRAGRAALRPSTGDRERVFAALRARLGDAALLGSGTAWAGAGTARMLWPLISAAVVGLGVAGGVLFASLHRPAPAPVPSAVAVSAPALSAPAGEPSEAALPEAPAAAPQPRESATPASNKPASESAALTRRAPGHLAQEVALLSRATNELRAGHAAAALKALDAHERTFPNGALAEERRAAKVQALCALGKRREADAELGRLTRSAPQSPQAARARQFCTAQSSL